MRLILALLLAFVAGPATPRTGLAAGPALWVVRDADTRLYLFGTVHVLPRDIDWLRGDVRRAFDSADTLVLELVIPSPSAMAALIVRAGYDDRLAPPSPKLRAAADRLAIPHAAFDGMKPWLAATTLSIKALDQLGYDRDSGVEARLTKAARRADKPITGLESAEIQLAMFDSLPRAAQATLLSETIDALPQTGPTMARTVTAWSKGDADTLAAIVNADVAGSPALAKALLTDRNARWAAWIKRRMDQPGTVFVAVGAGHLAGRDSVQAVLARKGIRVTRVAP